LGSLLAACSPPVPFPCPALTAEVARYYDQSRTAALAAGFFQALSAISLFVFAAPVAAFVRRIAGERSAPPSEFAEWTLGDAGLEDFILDLHAPAPDEVRAWLSVPARLRVIGPSYEPERDSDYFMSINSLAESFDAIIQLEEVTPTRLLLPRR